MKLTLLISDMHGKAGNIEYLSLWGKWLAQHGRASKIIWVDQLLPEIYAPLQQEAIDNLHGNITSEAAISTARSRLADHIRLENPDAVIGCSYGGYLAALARDAMAAQAKLICLSSTRLRYLLPIATPCKVHAIFGEKDPFRPKDDIPQSDLYYSIACIAGADHEFYRQPSSCGEILKDILES
ncbi:hypothetical protein [Chromobacterium alticapitis]|uniref:Alpha/beta hydrolase n=1 Tax=Chromobacterium alticapitis TaxID=2073169 RepID=A0A2S5DBT4_9NEIS|nr:hypothetical protein [Chromobacterium alticapitis]POZ60471.1 hypothetical protein C2I19_18500 [Chromobacterium alticapitis]